VMGPGRILPRLAARKERVLHTQTGEERPFPRKVR
jgi:hypothetical protein